MDERPELLDKRRADRSDEPLADSQPSGRFQFTLRTLLLATFVVALFCSAAATFEGMGLFLAVTAIAWATIGAVYWKIRVPLVVTCAHACGPVFGGIMWAVSAWRHSIWAHVWEVLLGVGLAASVVVSVHLTCVLRFRRRAVRRFRSW